MIINLRGPSGAGKSTLVRRVMSYFPTQNAFYVDGRKKPIGYGCLGAGTRPLWVVGHYEVACGGGDTIDDLDEVFAQVRSHAGGCDVIFEGLMIQCETRRLIELHRHYPVIAIALTTPMELCLAGIQARRDARGDTRPLNPAGTIKKLKDMNRQRLLLRDCNVDYRRLSREQAEQVIVGVLGLAAVAA